MDTRETPRGPLTDAELDKILGSSNDPPPPPTRRAGRATDSTPPVTVDVPVDVPAADPEPPRKPFDPVAYGLKLAVVAVTIGALLTALGMLFGIGPAAPSGAHAATAAAAVRIDGRPCSAPLSHGRAMITRSTARIDDGARRFYTSVTLATTGDRYRLIVDRGVGADPIAGVITRVQRGVGGDVSGVRSWGFGSRTGNVNVHVSFVDLMTGAYGTVSC